MWSLCSRPISMRSACGGVTLAGAPRFGLPNKNAWPTRFAMPIWLPTPPLFRSTKWSNRCWSFLAISCRIQPMTASSSAFAFPRTAGQPTRHVSIVLWLLLLLLPVLAVPSSITRAADSRLNLAGPVVGPETLDPAQVRDLSSLVMFRQIFRGLMLYDDNLNPQPEIAKSVDISEDGLTYSVSLRANATFQDGTPITSDDVL